MNKIFTAKEFFRVPDGTMLSPFLNATDVMQTELPWEALGDVSVALGKILAGEPPSLIHLLPAVTQITYVLRGELSVAMKEPGEKNEYILRMEQGKACVTQPGTLFQLINDSTDVVEMLYIVSPSYVFNIENEKVIYDDTTLIAKSWSEIAEMEKSNGLKVPDFQASKKKRTDALRDLKHKFEKTR